MEMVYSSSQLVWLLGHLSFTWKKWLSQTVTRVLNLTPLNLPFPTRQLWPWFDLYSLFPLILARKCIRNSRGWSQVLHFLCKYLSTPLAVFSTPISVSIAYSGADKCHQAIDMDKYDKLDCLPSCSSSKTRSRINYSCLESKNLRPFMGLEIASCLLQSKHKAIIITNSPMSHVPLYHTVIPAQ